MVNVLIYSENTDLALEMLTAGKEVGTVKAVSVNNEEQNALLAAQGAEVYSVKQADLMIADSGAVADILKQAAEQLDCSVIMLSSDRRGKLLAGRLAQKMNAGCLTGVSSLRMDGEKLVCERNVLGGAVIAEQTILSGIQILALLPKRFAIAENASDGGSIQELAARGAETGLTFISSRPKEDNTVDISAAEILLVVGQGIEDRDDLSVVETIAKAVGGEVACTKPIATDKKWFTEDRIIGISGKSCKPRLAVLLGISGQVQFYAGIRDATTIVVVNKDENAPIMSMADYLVNADLREVLPTLKNVLV